MYEKREGKVCILCNTPETEKRKLKSILGDTGKEVFYECNGKCFYPRRKNRKDRQNEKRYARNRRDDNE